MDYYKVPSLYYVSKRTGWVGRWVQKKVIFADVQYCIYADIMGGWVGLKKSKNVLT
jgi:hypothetical protein